MKTDTSAFRLSEVHDVGNVAIITLREKGYRVWWEPSERPAADDWWAEKEGREFVARNPLALLGLVTLWSAAAMSGKRSQASRICCTN